MLNRFEKKDLDYAFGYADYKHPNLILNPDKTNFYEFTIDDFTMEGYEPVKPQLKLELGI